MAESPYQIGDTEKSLDEGLLRHNQLSGKPVKNLDDGPAGNHPAEKSPDEGRPGHKHWDNQTEFILSCVGYAVGIGNLWRFPYLCLQNGGGAFLIPYFICLFFCGFPLFFLEACLGQFSGLSPLELWDICPIFKGLGYGMIIVSGLLCIYYNIIISWVLYYMFRSMAKVLPWSSCTNHWNTFACFTVQSLENDYANLTTNISTYGISNVTDIDNHNANKLVTAESSLALTNMTTFNISQWRSATEEFWYYEVLEISPGISHINGVRWEIFGCFLFSWIVVYLCIFKGAQSIGKVVYITAVAPYILLTIMLIRGVTLPGAINGIIYYLIPDWSKLLDFRVWATAQLQVFYSLGPAWGGIIVMSSYNRFNNNCIRDSIIVSIISGFTSFYSGFVIFSVLGFIAHKTGSQVKEFVRSGPGLAFIAYPEAIAELPLSPIWSVFFFLTLFTLGLDTQFATLDTVTTSFYDVIIPRKLRKHKWLWTILVCVVIACLGMLCVTRAGVYFFQIMDWYSGTFSVIIIALFECIAFAWIYGYNRLYQDMEMMFGSRPSPYWKICWCIIAPLMLIASILYSIFAMKDPVYGDYHYPKWAIGFGWTLAMISIVPLPVFFIKALLQQKGSIVQRLIAASRPTKTWGPSHPKYRASYKHVTDDRRLSGLCQCNKNNSV